MTTQGANFTPEQFTELLKSLRPESSGLGGAPRSGRSSFGFGSCSCDNPINPDAKSMLAAGSPRLALAVCRGVQLAPQTINVRATFPNTSVDIVPDVGSDTQITQDTFVEGMLVRIENQSETANQNQFQAQSDWYYNFQSGIEATLSVTGTPRYTVADKTTPLASLLDTINGNSHWPRGWVLMRDNQLKMDFVPKVLLPFAPIEVICTFRCLTPVVMTFVTMTQREAIEYLSTEFGIMLSDSYVQRVLSA